MANNANVNKVEYAGKTLIDLTGDTAAASDVVAGKTFHLASGAAATGTADYYTKTETDALLDKKVDAVSGKGLSANDYTTAEKTKLAGIAAGAQVNTITGVKGNSESSYRTGNVNITAANVGAVDLTSNQTVGGTKTFTTGPVVDVSGTKLEKGDIKYIFAFKYKNSLDVTKTVNVVRAYGDSHSGTNGAVILGSSSGATIITSGDITAVNVVKNNSAPHSTAPMSDGEGIHLIADGTMSFWVNANGTTQENPTEINAMNILTDGTLELSNPLPIGSGGTGAATAEAARTALGAAPAGFGLGGEAQLVTNLDNCDASGFYRISRANANTNHGINNTLDVLHIKHTDIYAAQIAFGITSDAVYYRRKNNSTWQPWRPLTLETAVPAVATSAAASLMGALAGGDSLDVMSGEAAQKDEESASLDVMGDESI